MRLKLLHFTLICLLFKFTALGQIKYIKTASGKIIDTVTYNKLKVDKIDKFKSAAFPLKVKVVILDNFKEIKRTKDSVIYTYSWEQKNRIRATVQRNNGFDPDNYIDKVFPVSSLVTLDNKPITINDLKGKPTLINFWFANCKPCIEEMPVLNKIKEQFKDRVNFVAITYETKEKVLDFLKKHNYTFTQIAGARKFIDKLKINSYPVNVFLDKNGIAKEIENGIPYEMNDKEEAIMGDGKNFIEILEELIHQ